MQYQLTQKGRTTVELGLKFNLDSIDQIEQICKDWFKQKELKGTEDDWGCLRMFVKSEMVILIDGKLSDVSPKGWELANGEYRQRQTIKQINK